MIIYEFIFIVIEVQCLNRSNDIIIFFVVQILQFSKFLLLQTACPDSIFRVKSTPLRGEYENIQNIYFKEQHHSSIQDFLDHCLSQNNQGSLLLQVLYLILIKCIYFKTKLLIYFIDIFFLKVS